MLLFCLFKIIFSFNKKIPAFCVIIIGGKKEVFMRIKEAVSSLIQEAIDCHASDLFFLIQKGKLVVNFRTINGIAN